MCQLDLVRRSTSVGLVFQMLLELFVSRVVVLSLVVFVVWVARVDAWWSARPGTLEGVDACRRKEPKAVLYCFGAAFSLFEAREEELGER